MRAVRIGALVSATCLTLLAAAPPAGQAHSPYGPRLTAPEPPDVTAEAWILYDDTYGQVLAEVDADSRRAVASTTKILTALVVLEHTRLHDLVIITETAASVGESEIGLVAGEAAWLVEELLAALMLWSANDAAVALAQHVGGSVAGFSEMMNRKVAELGLINSNFVNPHGLDHRDHYSSARDMLSISLAAMENAFFARLAGIRSFSLPHTPDGEPRVAVNRNDLLATYPGALGIKTGYTGRALQTLSAVAERDGRRVYAVVLGSEDHFGDVTLLLDYAFGNFTPLTLVPVTSDLQRPLAGGLVSRPGTDFEVFSDQHDQPAPAPPGTAAGPEAGDGTDGDAAPSGRADVADQPVEPVTRRVERQVELPGVRDALIWIRQYWLWIRGGG